MLKKKINLPSAAAMSKALNEVRLVQAKHDARIMLLVFLDRAALVARQLKTLGMETDASIESVFMSAHGQTKKALKIPSTFNPDAKPAGKLS